MKKTLFTLMAVAFIAAGCTEQSVGQQPQQQTPQQRGTVNSITVEPSYKNAGWTMYGDGAVVKVMAPNVQSVEIKYYPTGTGQKEQILGQATSLSSQQGAWVFQLPAEISATNVWAEAKDFRGETIKSRDLGNVGYIPVSTYGSPTKYGFSIQYPEGLGFGTDINKVRGLAYIPVCDEQMVACVYLGRDAYKGTNFDGAGVSINIHSDLNTEAKCYNFQVSTNAAQTPVADVSINGVSFKSATGGDAGLGHSETVQVYRNFHSGICYEIAQHVGSTSIGNYEPGTVKEFNYSEVWNRMQYVVNTFKFTAGPPAANGNITVVGDLVCLPRRDVQPGQPQTLECAIGLKETTTGKYYGLKNSPNPVNGTTFQVTGKLVANPTSKYDVAGYIEVESVKVLK